MVPFLTLVVISLSHRLKGIPLYRSQQIEFVPDLVAFLLLSECRSCNKIKLSNMGTSLLYEGNFAPMLQTQQQSWMNLKILTCTSSVFLLLLSSLHSLVVYFLSFCRDLWSFPNNSIQYFAKTQAFRSQSILVIMYKKYSYPIQNGYFVTKKF